MLGTKPCAACLPLPTTAPELRAVAEAHAASGEHRHAECSRVFHGWALRDRPFTAVCGGQDLARGARLHPHHLLSSLLHPKPAGLPTGSLCF